VLVAPGSQIILYAGAEKPKNTVTVPQLYGKTLAEARKTLESMGLFIRSSGTLATSSKAVISTQSVPKGEEAVPGTVIDVTLVDPTILGHY
jgi:stage V sporulation protein D (sporulation-specific penicillin-binding protein)